MSEVHLADRLIASRRRLMEGLPAASRSDEAAEGGCGVLGFAANLPIAGRHVLTASRQMHNRGNGKGGGIAMVGLDPRQAGVDRQTLRSHYLLQIALLDARVKSEVEAQYIEPFFEVAHAVTLPRLDDYRQVEGLEIQPPEVQRYFVRVKTNVLQRFADEYGLDDLPARTVEDEFVYQNSFRLNRQFYASLGEKRAFTLSHGRNLSALKIVGYAEQVVEYYCLQDQTAHVWIAHQRYPTKGRVWHPGGAHPFIGLNEALVHNGDFANYHAVSEYLRQRNIGQLFLTDTEVSVQLFDLWDRVYGYPLEITLEALAPTTEHDFAILPAEKQELYRTVQRTHIHGSPDGPWFFIIARSVGDEDADCFELLGVTDTSMLRPQVFALYENQTQNGAVQMGLIASERQAINACMRSLAEEDERFQPLADHYWAARGGSHTDGGAFRFSVTFPSSDATNGALTCANKFGQLVRLDAHRRHLQPGEGRPERAADDFKSLWQEQALRAFDNGGSASFWNWLQPRMARLSWDEIASGLSWLDDFAHAGDDEWRFSLEALSVLRDRHYDLGDKKRASLLRLVDDTLLSMFDRLPLVQSAAPDGGIRRLDWRRRLIFPTDEAVETAHNEGQQAILVLDARGFPAEGDECAARYMVRAWASGWRRIIAYGWRGGRFAACGLGASDGLRVDLYGDVGDYAASGLDGAEVHLHGDGQDQLGQIFKRGKLVIYGDAGQTFLYGAKGGEIYVQGSVAGRPLINAVGKPRAIINGACLDYLAESFMAGDPLNGGGFVILNGIVFDEQGRLVEMETPYPGGNLFSLASGGAIYLRDPRITVTDAQLNGGAFTAFEDADWRLIEPYLRENERLFGISVGELLMVDNQLRSPSEVYRKVAVNKGMGVLSDAENR